MNIRRNIFMYVLIGLLFLTACSNKEDPQSELFVKTTHNGEDINIISERPALIFFFTSYT